MVESRNTNIYSLNPNNKLWNYIQFYYSDKVLWEFIDYVWFYGVRNNRILINLLRSDNGASVYCWRITLTPWENKQLFTAFGSVCYCWKVVNIFRLQHLKIPTQNKNDWYLKVDLYWKWVKLIREQWLWDDFYTVLTRYCWLQEIVLTRTDYTVDTAKYHFWKKNSLNARKHGSISSTARKVRDRDLDMLNTQVFNRNQSNKHKRKQIQYLLFGDKNSSTARFIRYYDKKAEIVARWTQFLYPEYFDIPNVMRYELQVNSKWFNDEERYLQVEDLKKFIDFEYHVGDRKVNHEATKNWTLYEYIAYGIKKLKRENDYTSIEKIKLLLWDESEIWGTDSRVLCETFDQEKLFEHF